MNAEDNPLVGYASRLDTFDINELDSVYDAVTLARGMFLGIVNQPRFDKDGDLSEAGKEVERFINALNVYADAVQSAAVSASPKSSYEVEHRAWLLLKHSIRCEAGLSEHAIQAAGFAAQFATAKKLEAGRR